MRARRPISITCMVALSVGCRDAPPAGAPVQRPWFTEASTGAGLVFRYESGHDGTYLFPEIMGGGAALFDADGDGDLDAYLVQAGSLRAAPGERPPNRLFLNRGDGAFDDVTGTSGAGDRGYGMGVACGDYDGDGDVDLYVTNVGPNALLRNEGGGRFTDVTAAAGVGDPAWGASAGFLDHDRDGDLDLFVSNYVVWSLAAEIDCRGPAGLPDYCSPNSYHAPAPDTLYRNEGDGTFTDVSVEAGLRSAYGNGLGVAFGDLDGDGLADIFVANDQLPNQLWRNRGDGTFEDVAPLAGCAVDTRGEAKAGMGVIAMDADDDGDLDILVVNLVAQGDSLFLNEGGWFADGTARAGLGVAPRRHTRFGMALADFDHDGRLDLFEANGRVARRTAVASGGADPYAEANLLMAGGSGGRFAEVPGDESLIATSRGAAFGDVDGDGDLDVLIVNRDERAHLMINESHKRGNWIILDVREASGAPALGATVTLRAGDRTIRRDVTSAWSYCAANDPRIHVGLGPATRVEDVQVRWADGATRAFGDLDAGGVVRLDRGG